MPTLEETVALEGMSNEEALQAGLLYSRLLKNPATRSQALQLMKTNDPNLHIPEVDIPTTFETHLKPIREQLEALVKENGQLKLEGARKGILEDLVAEGLADTLAEAKLIEKFALDEKIADYKSAAKFYRMSQKMAEPTPDTSVTGGPLEMPIDFKEIGKNPKSWADKAAVAALNDFRKTNRAA